MFILQRVEIPSKEGIKIRIIVWLFAHKHTLLFVFVQACQKSTVRHDFMGSFVTGLYNGMVTGDVNGCEQIIIKLKLAESVETAIITDTITLVY